MNIYSLLDVTVTSVNLFTNKNCTRTAVMLLSGVPDYFGRIKISSGGDLSHYSSASLY